MVPLYRLTLILTLLSVGCVFPTLAQTVRKLERAATNRTHPTLVNGDTIQRFTTTRHRPSPNPDRMYYWQSQDHILRFSRSFFLPTGARPAPTGGAAGAAVGTVAGDAFRRPNCHQWDDGGRPEEEGVGTEAGAAFLVSRRG